MKTLGLSVVCIFSKNSLADLIYSLESFIRFANKVDEFILVGGCESQKSAISSEISALSGSAAQIMDKFILCLEEDCGISHAFNKAVLISNYSHVLFCNSGDLLIDVPAKNEFFHALILMPNLLLQLHSGGNKLIKPLPSIHFPNRFVHPGSVVSKEVFAMIGLFSGNLKVSMDYDFFSRAVLARIKILLVNRPFVHQSPSGASALQPKWHPFVEPLIVITRYSPFSLSFLRNLPRYLAAYLYVFLRKVFYA